MKKKIILLAISMLVFPMSVFAKSSTNCNYSELANLKKYASNINVMYDYYIENNEAYFNVTINNVTPEMYILDEVTGQKYYYSAENKGEIVIRGYNKVQSLKYTAYSNIPTCMDNVLSRHYIQLPIYNRYANDPLCNDIKGFRLCQRFLITDISYEDFVRQTKKYINDKDKPIEEEKEEKEKIKNFESWQDIVLRYSPLAAILIIALVIYIIQRRK